MKRYAIVRVENKCPLNIEDDFYCSAYMQKDKCKKCKEFRGDTKEQLERKIAQVLFKRKVKLYKKIWGCDMGSIEKEDRYKQCLEIAEEIIEFLGVEE